jgi:hypothetical protein
MLATGFFSYLETFRIEAEALECRLLERCPFREKS